MSDLAVRSDRMKDGCGRTASVSTETKAPVNVVDYTLTLTFAVLHCQHERLILILSGGTAAHGLAVLSPDWGINDTLTPH